MGPEAVDRALAGLTPAAAGRRHPRRGPVAHRRRRRDRQDDGDHPAYCVADRHPLSAKPSEILALTFTEKAAAEMESRVDELVPYGYTDTWINTFHAFGDRMLRDQALEAGLSPDFRVLSRPEQFIFFRDRLFEMPLDALPAAWRPDAIRRGHSLADQPRQGRRHLAGGLRGVRHGARGERGRARLPRLSWPMLRPRTSSWRAPTAPTSGCSLESGRVDFGDLIVLPLHLLRGRPDILQRYQDRFRYILVDEFQDTNHAQFELVKLLAASHRNITVVGDDDQSIYKFRGAAISNILGFTAAYPDARQVVFTENFRSPQSVLDAAYRLIQHNNPDRLEVRNKLDKRLVSRHGEGAGVRHLHFDTLTTETDAVAGMIADHVAGGGRWGDCAILVRANQDADPFLRALNMRGIPWWFSGTRGLYDREEVRVVLAFLRVLASPLGQPEPLLSWHLAALPHRCDATWRGRCPIATRRNRSLEHLFRNLKRGARALG